MNISYATISSTGKRANNEDACLVTDSRADGRWMGIVCDGMGGHAMGEVAAETVVAAIADHWAQSMGQPDSEAKVLNAVRSAYAAVERRADSLGHCEMGTTMVMASISANTLTVGNIGDSRCYVFRKNYQDSDDVEKRHIRFQTTDHVGLCQGWEIVTRSVFSYRPEVAVPDVTQLQLQPGDRILLCTDGVYGCIHPALLKGKMISEKTPAQIIADFDLICRQHSHDNYTAVVVRIEE